MFRDGMSGFIIVDIEDTKPVLVLNDSIVPAHYFAQNFLFVLL